MVYHFKFAKENKWYTAQCIEIEGCLTQAQSMPELIENCSEALNLHLAEPQDSKIVFPPPRQMAKSSKILEIAVDPQVALALTLKNLRRSQGKTQKAIAAELGIENVFVYQKLENPKTSNPGIKTLAKLKQVFPELSLDDLFKKAE